MEDNIVKLVDQIKQSTNFQINKQILREKIQTDLHFTYEGGLFKATPELISFVQAWYGDNQRGYQSQMFMEDTYGNPILINSIIEFSRIARMHYHSVMNTWHQQHADLKRARKV